ncbi:hypothetical protein GCM10022420_029130 [Streptomyces iranensis]
MLPLGPGTARRRWRRARPGRLGSGNTTPNEDGAEDRAAADAVDTTHDPDRQRRGLGLGLGQGGDRPGRGLGTSDLQGRRTQGPDHEPGAERQHQHGHQEAEDAWTREGEYADDRSEDHAGQSVQHQSAHERSRQLNRDAAHSRPAPAPPPGPPRLRQGPGYVP